MKASEKNEPIYHNFKKPKKEQKNEKTSALKINMHEDDDDDDETKEYLSSIDNEVLTKLGCFSSLGTHLAKLKLKVNKFYFIYIILTIIHFSIYVNRGIIPGSYDYLSSYLKEIYAATNVDVHIGFLTSVFVFGLSISSILSGSLASTYSVFRITDLFLLQNSLALFLTGISFIIGSYYSLMFSRFFCGFSEAAFITIIPPLIYSYSKDRAGSWISIFITMFPLGGCIGYLLAVFLPMLKISVAQYFIASGTIFMLFFLCFYLFDENLLKKYEEEKSMREQEKSKREKQILGAGTNDLEEGAKNSTASDKNGKKEPDVEKGKNQRNSTKGNAIGANAVGANAEGFGGVNEKKHCSSGNSTQSSSGATSTGTRKEEKKNSESNRDAENVITTSSGAGIRAQENKKNASNSSSIRNVANKQHSLTNKDTQKSSNLKHRDGGKLQGSRDTQLQNVNSTDNSDRKLIKEGTAHELESNKEGTNNNVESNYGEMSHQLGEEDTRSFNNTISFNSTHKNYSNMNNIEYMQENSLGIMNSCEEQPNISNNSYINNNLDKMYLAKSFGDDALCLNTTQESYRKVKKDENYLDIEIDNCIESLDEEKNNDDLNLGLLVNTTLTNISFLILVTALTAHTDMIQCYLVYGAPILYALKIFPSYKTATVMCSLCACLSSIVGTCLGGFLMDFHNLNIQNIDKNYEHINNNEKKIKIYSKDVMVYEYLRIIGIQTFIILVIASFLVMFIPFITNMYLFTVVMTLGLTFLFSSMPGQNIGIMVCVPQNIRAFSIGMSSFISHLLGDIPWTIIIGKIKGTLSPDCVVTRNGELSELCYEQSRGLRITQFIICSKSLLMAAACFLLNVYAKKKIKKYRNKQNNA
ncbi:transporter [Plasmodium gonderi]|uniref:Transporter n=1 Tax=Plasmodium gonderi TaxID=77519 RepID=A0A1Y1JI22_PLAGO|nr:transporter [Plasmodium gonderi]GAW81880.1 transporter [Plasmodium gonderi]